MKTVYSSLLAAALVLLAACTGSKTDPSTPSNNPTVSSSEVSSLFSREAGSALSGYRAQTTSYRLLGVQGEGSNAFATLMDVASYRTVNVNVGSLLARNLMLTNIAEDAAELSQSSGSPLSLKVGSTTQVREILHDFDQMSVPMGRNAYQVKQATLHQVLGAHGPGATTARQTIFPDAAAQLNGITPDGVLGRLGFQEGDLVFRVNGEDVSSDDAATLVSRLGSAGILAVDIYRSGDLMTLSLAVQ